MMNIFVTPPPSPYVDPRQLYTPCDYNRIVRSLNYMSYYSAIYTTILNIIHQTQKSYNRDNNNNNNLKCIMH